MSAPAADGAAEAWCGSLVVDWIRANATHDSKTLTLHMDAHVTRCLPSRPQEQGSSISARAALICPTHHVCSSSRNSIPTEPVRRVRALAASPAESAPAEPSHSTRKELLKFSDSEVHFGSCEVGSYEERKVGCRQRHGQLRAVRCCQCSHTYFPPHPSHQIKLCNRSLEDTVVTIFKPDERQPFSVRHSRLRLKPRSFVLFPVRFEPERTDGAEIRLQCESNLGRCSVLLTGTGTGQFV